MRVFRRTSTAAALLLATALALTGCSGSSSSSSGGSSGGTKVAAGKNDLKPTPRDDVKQGGQLRWPIDQAIANFNYNEVDGPNQNTVWILNAIMPNPFHFDAGGNPSVDTDYFTDIKLTSSSPQTVQYDINPKAVWSDGKPITAADLIAQWKACNGTNPAYNVAGTTGYDQIGSVTQGSSAQQAIVTFSKPFGDWKSLFSPLFPASLNSDPNAFNTGWVDKPLVTSGPFTFTAADTSAQTYTVTANPTWWGDKPKLDSIIYRVINDDVTIDSLANNEIDLMNIGPDANAYKRAQKISGVEVRRAGGPNFRHITINGSGAILSDLKVRQAFALAVDRKAIAKALLGPFGGTPQELNNHFYMENQTGYQDNAGQYSTPDVAKANKILQADGWTRSGDSGTRMKDGKPLTLNYVIPAGTAATAQESQLVQAMENQVGIKVTIQSVPGDDYFAKYITPGAYDLTDFAWLGTQFPVSGSTGIYKAPVGDQIQENYARLGSPEIDAALVKANADLDPDQQRKDGNAADKLIWDEVHTLTLYQRPDLWGVRKNLVNVGAYGFADLKYQDIGFTK